MEFSKNYNPIETEKEIYQKWLEGNFFSPKIDKTKKPFVIVIPPPNITGSLHMGHALNNTIQDILIRVHRMKGEPTLWLPGTDHAGIATQNIVEKQLLKKGITRQALGRKKFVEQVWQWKEKYGNIILDQLKRLGCSCDWSRTRFTMDEKYSQAVKEAFIKFYQDGLIYRGYRIVNWCPRCGTSLSDIELEYKEELGHLYYIKYKLKAEKQTTKEEYITVATTRPETMLGDTAVAVNPNDRRYKKLIGKIAILPIQNREIPIIADKAIDSSFGTGALKVTPAHDLVDYEIGERHNLEALQVIGEDGLMTAQAGEAYEGLSVSEARDKVVDALSELGLLEKIEEYSHSVAHCYRCDTVIEPLLSKQWFVSMKKLAKPAIKEAQKGLKFVPARFKKVYLDWLKNIRDWNISRQLWWGHQLPVYFCKNKQETISSSGFRVPSEKNAKKLIHHSENFVVSKTKPQKCPFCKKCKMVQSEDVLDTWFSSALWPFATLGWPDTSCEDYKYFYPTSTLVTARDIMHLWVSRMVMTGLFFTKQRPFDTVIINATVLTKEGKRMSKSLGTGIDPLELISQYGADATRFGLITQAAKGQDIRFQVDQIRAARNFANKIWNIGRFILMKNKPQIKFTPESFYQKWVITKLNKLIRQCNKSLQEYDFSEYAKAIYHFTWNQFASIYLEKVKNETDENSIASLYYIYEIILKLLHPLMPHLTEKLYSYFSDAPLITALWPEIAFSSFPSEEKAVDLELAKLAEQRSKIVPENKIKKIKNYIKILEAKLANKNFVNNAPKEIVDAQKKKLAEAKAKLQEMIK